MDTTDTIANAVKLEIRRRGMTLSEAAALCDMKQQAFSMALNGTRAIGGRLAHQLEAQFGMNAHYLMTGEGSLLPGPADTAPPREAVIPDVETIRDMAATIRSQQETIREQMEMLRDAAGWQRRNIERLLSLNGKSSNQK